MLTLQVWQQMIVLLMTCILILVLTLCIVIARGEHLARTLEEYVDASEKTLAAFRIREAERARAYDTLLRDLWSDRGPGAA